ncbi:MAG TPA: 4-hydroxy-tetrahydrodipicolinate reductase [Bacteroidales bacterium]|nr:4-hydroxy-tetrahydrodipicolinate reductase [Bacteroidales bacterium]
MKIALIGYGKMGKEIEAVALERKHTIALTIDLNNQHELTAENLKKADVAIEFTNPETAYHNVLKCFEADVPVVSGSTGWNEKVEEARKKCIEGNHSFIWSSNYSLGVNIFFKINDYLAKIMNNYSNYEVSIDETHHTQKLDAPSGTAITLANGIIRNIERKKQWQLNNQESSDKLKITAIRRDNIPGIHTINYDSAVDYIEITHSAKNRKGLAFGAVLAAEYIHNKKGAFTMDDLLSI